MRKITPSREGGQPDEKTYRRLFILYLVMFKIGCFTFGGGWSIIAQISEEFHQKRNWVTEEQIMDFMALARSFPGIMVVNYSVLFGYTTAGIPGAVMSAAGLVSPAVLIIAVIANFYDAVSQSHLVMKMMSGVRSAVIPIMAAAAWKLKKKALVSRYTWLLCLFTMAVCLFTSLNKLALVIGCGLLGAGACRFGKNGGG